MIVIVRDSAMETLHRQQEAAVVNRGAIVNIVSWILAVVAICVLVARFAMKLAMKTRRRMLGLDDLLIGLAAIFSFGQTLVVSVESIHALGQHGQNLTFRQKAIFQKTEYVACMLYIANMGCARISMCCLVAKILPDAIPRHTALILAAFTTVWTVSGILVTSFACSLPHPWEFLKDERCLDVVAFVNYTGVTNIIAETLLVAIPLMAWNVRLSAWKCISVSVVFLTRLSIVAAVGAQLHFFNHSTLSDPSYDLWPVVLCRQIAQNLSIISACLPCLHPFIIRMLAGTVKSDTVSFSYSTASFTRRPLGCNTSSFEFPFVNSSQSSNTNFSEKMRESYCRPLATYGLDGASNHRYPHSTSRFSSNVAKPIFTPQPLENVFNRLIEVPQSRPATSYSTTDPLAMPERLSDVGVLPAIDWDAESSASEDSRRNSPPRRPTTAYVFSRQKVVSVPDELHLYDEGSQKFTSPQPSPRMPKRPSLAFR